MITIKNTSIALLLVLFLSFASFTLVQAQEVGGVNLIQIDLLEDLKKDGIKVLGDKLVDSAKKTTFGFEASTGILQGISFSRFLSAIISSIFYVVDLLLNLLVIVAYGIYGIVITFVLYGLAEIVENPVVSQAWGLFRDLANIIITILLIYSAYMTIFNNERFHIKKMAAGLFIGAIFVNFSAFITRVLIDISNYFSLFAGQHFQQALSTVGNQGVTHFVAKVSQTGATAFTGDALGSVIAAVFFSILLKTLFVALLAYVGGILIYRALIFIVLLVTSPLAVLSFSFGRASFPMLSNFGNKWSSYMVTNMLYLPLFILLFGVVLTSVEAFVGTITDGPSYILGLFSLSLSIFGLHFVNKFLKDTLGEGGLGLGDKAIGYGWKGAKAGVRAGWRHKGKVAAAGAVGIGLGGGLGGVGTAAAGAVIANRVAGSTSRIYKGFTDRNAVKNKYAEGGAEWDKEFKKHEGKLDPAKAREVTESALKAKRGREIKDINESSQAAGGSLFSIHKGGLLDRSLRHRFNPNKEPLGTVSPDKSKGNKEMDVYADAHAVADGYYDDNDFIFRRDKKGGGDKGGTPPPSGKTGGGPTPSGKTGGGPTPSGKTGGGPTPNESKNDQDTNVPKSSPMTQVETKTDTPTTPSGGKTGGGPTTNGSNNEPTEVQNKTSGEERNTSSETSPEVNSENPAEQQILKDLINKGQQELIEDLGRIKRLIKSKGGGAKGDSVKAPWGADSIQMLNLRVTSIQNKLEELEVKQKNPTNEDLSKEVPNEAKVHPAMKSFGGAVNVLKKAMNKLNKNDPGPK